VGILGEAPPQALLGLGVEVEVEIEAVNHNDGVVAPGIDAPLHQPVGPQSMVGQTQAPADGGPQIRFAVLQRQLQLREAQHEAKAGGTFLL
jgi:hypothetical protein